MSERIKEFLANVSKLSDADLAFVAGLTQGFIDSKKEGK